MWSKKQNKHGYNIYLLSSSSIAFFPDFIFEMIWVLWSFVRLAGVYFAAFVLNRAQAGVILAILSVHLC